MVAAKNRMIDDAATTIYQLTADERIRQQCEAREDYLRRQRGIQKILERQRQQLAEQKQQLTEQKQQLTEKDQQLMEQKQQLTTMKSELQEANKRLQELERQMLNRK